MNEARDYVEWGEGEPVGVGDTYPFNDPLVRDRAGRIIGDAAMKSRVVPRRRSEEETGQAEPGVN